MPMCTWLGNEHARCIHWYADSSQGYYTNVMVGELVGSRGTGAICKVYTSTTYIHAHSQPLSLRLEIVLSMSDCWLGGRDTRTGAGVVYTCTV